MPSAVTFSPSPYAMVRVASMMGTWEPACVISLTKLRSIFSRLSGASRRRVSEE